MKIKLILKLLFLAFFSLSLQSCYVSKAVLSKENSYKENFNKMLVDIERKKVIFISDDEKYHYVISDDDNSIINLALWDGFDDLKFSAKYGSALLKDDSEFEIPYFILLTNKDVTNEKQIAFLESLGFNEVEASKHERGKMTKNFIAKSGKKIGAKKNAFKDAQSVNLDSPYQIEFLVTKESASQKAGKLLLLPLAAVADVVLLPITIPVWLVGKIESNKTK